MNFLVHGLLYTICVGLPVDKEILLPPKAPDELLDRQTLLNELNRAEKRNDAQMARYIDLALPKELSFSEQVALVREFVQVNFTRHGLCADIGIHQGKLDEDRKPISIEPSQPNILVLSLWRWNFVGYRQSAAICTGKSLHTTENGRKCEAELDKKFYGVEFVETGQTNLSLDEYLDFNAGSSNRRYRFLIMVGDGDSCNGLPKRLRTRLKTKLHRSVYVELAYYKGGKGAVKECYYYDREYRRQGIKIMPPMLISCFFPYTKKGILDLLNHEICCDFTHMLVTEGLDLDSNTTPLCGAI